MDLESRLSDPGGTEQGPEAPWGWWPRVMGGTRPIGEGVRPKREIESSQDDVLGQASG